MASMKFKKVSTSFISVRPYIFFTFYGLTSGFWRTRTSNKFGLIALENSDHMPGEFGPIALENSA